MICVYYVFYDIYNFPNEIYLQQECIEKHQVELCSRYDREHDFDVIFKQSGHKPGKHGKPGKLREFEKLSKSLGKPREI